MDAFGSASRVLSMQLGGGGGGIRTHEGLSSLPVFKTGAFNHSATPPGVIRLIASAGAMHVPRILSERRTRFDDGELDRERVEHSEKLDELLMLAAHCDLPRLER
jgi:hypothetical protein